jgi:hypothetical protein
MQIICIGGWMAIAHRLFLPPSFGAVLKIVASFSDSDFEKLASELNGVDAFDLDRGRSEHIAKAIGTDAETAGHIIQFCGYLYGQIHSRDVTAHDIPLVVANLVDTYADFENKDEREPLVERLCSVLGRRQSADSFRKAQRLRLGFLRNAISFSSLVDLRPDFSEDKKTVARLIPVAQVKISTDDDDLDFKDIWIQLDERSLARLKEAVNEMEQKFSTLHAEPIGAPVAKLAIFK